MKSTLKTIMHFTHNWPYSIMGQTGQRNFAIDCSRSPEDNGLPYGQRPPGLRHQFIGYFGWYP